MKDMGGIYPIFTNFGLIYSIFPLNANNSPKNYFLFKFDIFALTFIPKTRMGKRKRFLDKYAI